MEAFGYLIVYGPLALWEFLGVFTIATGIHDWGDGGFYEILFGCVLICPLAWGTWCHYRKEIALVKSLVALEVVLLVGGVVSAVRYGDRAGPQLVALKQRILADLRPMIKKGADPSPTADYAVEGKVLVWDMSEDREDYKIERNLFWGAMDSPLNTQVTVVFVLDIQRGELVGWYNSGRPAYRTYADLAVLQWPEKRLLGYKVIQGKEPPKELIFPPGVKPSKSGDPYLSDVIEPIETWISNLPAKRP